ncbi:MAG: DUF1365 domain-containing protein [Granulosicoccus sp.]
MTTRSCLYAGTVYHKRFKPRVHVLKYSVFSVFLDLAEIKQFDKKIWFFSHNRFNLVSFHDRDFGESPTEGLSEYIGRKLSDAGIQTSPERILLSCYPKILGFVFNPLSIFYCLDKNDQCFAIVHEVHNTFGERHAYVLPASHDTAASEQTVPQAHAEDSDQLACQSENIPRGAWVEQQAKKELFVSPFAHMGMNYRFRLNIPEEQQVIIIRASDESGLVIAASYTASRMPFNSTQLARFFIKIPLLTLKVVVGIHWEAVRLWLKGVPLFKHQPKSIN